MDALLTDFKRPENMTKLNDLFRQLLGASGCMGTASRADGHLDHRKNQPWAMEASNRNNGLGTKTHKGDVGADPFRLLATKQGPFEPQLITEHQTL